MAATCREVRVNFSRTAPCAVPCARAAHTILSDAIRCNGADDGGPQDRRIRIRSWIVEHDGLLHMGT
jgi:hypothetical protein